MNNSIQAILEVFCEVLNQVKRTGFTLQQLSTDAYLGGDLGIDSLEMLEIWYDMERRLNLSIADDEKRNILTLRDVVSVVERKLSAA